MKWNEGCTKSVLVVYDIKLLRKKKHLKKSYQSLNEYQLKTKTTKYLASY